MTTKRNESRSDRPPWSDEEETGAACPTCGTWVPVFDVEEMCDIVVPLEVMKLLEELDELEDMLNE